MNSFGNSSFLSNSTIYIILHTSTFMHVQYQIFKTYEMTSKIVLASILTTTVFLIFIRFSNSNPSSRLPLIRPDGKGLGPVRHNLLEINIKEMNRGTDEHLRQKRATKDNRKDKTKKKIKKVTKAIKKTNKKAKKTDGTIVAVVSGVIVLILVIGLVIYCCKN